MTDLREKAVDPRGKEDAVDTERWSTTFTEAPLVRGRNEKQHK